jgi:hypothetical protein
MKTPKTKTRRSLKRVVRPPVTDLQLVADELDAIATLMWGTAERMEYFGGFKGEMRQHAHELAGAATIARGWAKAIRARRPNDPSSATTPGKP